MIPVILQNGEHGTEGIEHLTLYPIRLHLFFIVFRQRQKTTDVIINKSDFYALGRFFPQDIQDRVPYNPLFVDEIPANFCR